jgi:hypothetical protein
MPQVPCRTGEDIAAVGGDEEHPLARTDHLHALHRQAAHAVDAAQHLLQLRRSLDRGRHEGRSNADQEYGPQDTPGRDQDRVFGISGGAPPFDRLWPNDTDLKWFG